MAVSHMEELAPLKSPSGHDAYCHVCWEPVYRFWAAKVSPDHSRCGIGDFSAQTCPNATGPVRLRADIARLKAEGLWPTTASANGYEAKRSETPPSERGKG